MPVLNPASLALQRGGSTLEAVAAHLGVHQAAVGHWFAGRRPPHPGLLEAVATLTSEAVADEIASIIGGDR